MSQPNSQQQSQTNSQQQPSGTSTGTGSQTPGSSSGSTSVNTIPQTAPPGTISFMSPSQTASPSYYKIAANNPITFAWNFTSLMSTPAALTVQAYCSSDRNTLPVGTANAQGMVNSVIPGTATQVVWDAYAQQTAPNGIPLVPATYTLRIFDERGFTAAAEPGKLSPNQNVKFAFYSPPPYTPISSGWQCTACNSARGLDVPNFLALGMTLMVMLVSGIGLLRGMMRG